MTVARIRALHRWISLIFALPLVLVILTGLILSFQPLLQGMSVVPGSLDTARLVSLIGQYDAAGKARGLSIDLQSGHLRLIGAGQPVEVDLKTGEQVQPTALGDLFQWARRTHQRLILDLNWLVVASTGAMLVIIALGVLMGWPRLRNTLAGWHKGIAWITLPLVILSPLTGLFLAFGVGGGGDGGPRPARSQPLPLSEAVKKVGETRDISRLTSLGTRGGRMMALINENDGLRAYALTQDGLAPLARSWPRAIHEGTWSAVPAGILNVVTSLALLGLLGTGMTIWARRTFRRRPARRPGTTPQPAQINVVPESEVAR